MRTINIELYEFKELDEKPKERAIMWYLQNCIYTDHIYSEAEKGVKAFMELFPGLRSRSLGWLYPDFVGMDDSKLNIKGIQLRKWVVNNLNINLGDTCPLSGYCYDEDLLKFVYKILKFDFEDADMLKKMTMREMIGWGFLALTKSIEDEIDAMHTEDYAIEMLNELDYEFDSYGNIHK